jgi:hypothetical protein
MMVAFMRNSMTTNTRLKILLIGFALIVLVGCAGQPLEYDAADEIPSGPGVLSGKDGEFTLYRSKEEKDSGTAADNSEAKEFRELQEWKKEAKEFKEFQEWKKTMQGSDESREFLEWRKWKKFKEWEKSRQDSE